MQIKHLPWDQEEQKFQQWKSTYAPNDSGVDYDLRAAYKAGLQPQGQNMHFPDTYKLPNHPTFSIESIYSGKDGKVGGQWKNESGVDIFYASPYNLTAYPKDKLTEYFNKYEPKAKLVLPK